MKIIGTCIAWLLIIVALLAVVATGVWLVSSILRNLGVIA